MRELKIKITEQLFEDLKRAAKARDMSIPQFAAFRLAQDRYDLITEELIREGHVSLGRCQKNETVL
jgi:hypothetical protein